MAKILFIEDEPNLQKTLGEFLNQVGHQVLKALDGEIGLNLAKKERPELILLDLILPKKDGFEVLGELKEDPTTKNIPVIILTNLEGSRDVEKALEMGATTYLIKANYDLKEIEEKINKALK